MNYTDLSETQRVLCDEAEQHDDSAVYLRAADGSAEDKAAVAEVFGGPGAGKEFLP